MFGSVSEGEVKTCIGQRQARVTNDARFFVCVFKVAKCKYIYFMSCVFKGTFVQVNVVCDAADIRFVCVCHHANFHVLNRTGVVSYCQDAYGRMTQTGEELVKLTLRDKEYEVKPGMNLLAALKKCNIVPESVIATREGEMILDDEILKDGDVVKLVSVISGGAL